MAYPSSVPTESPRTVVPLRWFYLALSGLLLLFVVIGFSPTFFLRPVFTTRPLPAYLHLHGALLTIWFATLFAQSCLIAKHRLDLHRRLGVVGAFDALALVPVSAFVVIKAIPRYIAAGVHPAEIQFIVIGDSVSIVVFSGLVIAALSLRRNREWHKRLMAVASIMIIGPAVARLERVGLAVPVPAVLLGLLLALALYDVRRLGRLHRATVVSSAIVVLALAALLAVVGTPTAQGIVERLSRW